MTRTSDYPLCRQKPDRTLCSAPVEHVQLSLCQFLYGRISTFLISRKWKFATLLVRREKSSFLLVLSKGVAFQFGRFCDLEMEIIHNE